VTVPDTSGVNPLENHTAAYFYDLSFRVAVFGVPLYFCKEDQVTPLMDALVPLIMDGLPPSF
jgi:hypothetical protein